MADNTSMPGPQQESHAATPGQLGDEWPAFLQQMAALEGSKSISDGSSTQTHGQSQTIIPHVYETIEDEMVDTVLWDAVQKMGSVDDKQPDAGANRPCQFIDPRLLTLQVLPPAAHNTGPPADEAAIPPGELEAALLAEEAAAAVADHASPQHFVPQGTQAGHKASQRQGNKRKRHGEVNGEKQGQEEAQQPGTAKPPARKRGRPRKAPKTPPPPKHRRSASNNPSSGAVYGKTMVLSF